MIGIPIDKAFTQLRNCVKNTKLQVELIVQRRNLADQQ